MTNSRVFLAAVAFLAAADCFSFNDASAQAQLKSGIYEGLMLAVSQQGAVSGYYREVQGTGVSKSCSFFLSGQVTGGQTDVVTWNIEAFPGSLRSADRGVVLRIANGRDHPGCGLVLSPLISEGLPLDLVSAADWISLRRVSVKKAFLFPKPEGGQKTRSYVVMGDVVGVLSQSGDWLAVEYVAGEKPVKGWMRTTEARELTPP
jgi:hypothetical protein